MSSSKKLTCKGTLRPVLICLKTGTPTHVYTLHIHTGMGGGGEPERKLEGQQFTKLGRKYQHD
jgi:hypothetical protein